MRDRKNNMQHKEFKATFGDKELKIEIGKLAYQANGSVLASYGGTTVLATCVLSKQPRDAGYLPLVVDYEERLYAVGKIRHARLNKREFRGSDEAISAGRLIDRTIRPLFNQKIRNEIQIILTVLSFDKENDPDIPSLIAASTALSISDIPWNGPIGGVRVVYSNKQWILNPTYEIREKSDLDIIVAGTKSGSNNEEKINMLEVGAGQISEEIVCQGIAFGYQELQKIVQFQEKIIQELKPQKTVLKTEELSSDLITKAEKFSADKLETIIYEQDKDKKEKWLEELKEELLQHLTKETEEKEPEKLSKQLNLFIEDQIDQIVHKNILEAPDGKEKRPDGRGLDKVRTIACEVGLLPLTHGSGLFQRGNTQSLAVVTLGSPGDEQIVDEMEKDIKKRFFLHYNFPPYCTGETRFLRAPSRREVGHGLLAERAILPLLPSQEDFPYTVRVVSEILSSNGSSSMASASGASLSLMDAGVPIKNSVSGVAMGLMSNDKKYKILTDIQGPEDHYGDMDCKIAGTKIGVTACQMDVKIEGVSLAILEKVFVQAKKARLEILQEMDKVIKQPREELAKNAPRILSLRINPEKIGAVVGPQGKVINGITSETGATIDIEQDGLIYVTAPDKESGEKAFNWIKEITREAKVGEIFQAKIRKIMEFGAFAEILPGQDGLIHISQLAPYRVNKVEDVVKMGEVVPVKVISIDEQGKISLSLKDAKKTTN